PVDVDRAVAGLVGEPEQGEAGTGRRVVGPVRQYLDRHVRPLAQHDQVAQLLRHDGRLAHPPAQGRLVEDEPQVYEVLAVEQRLPGEPDLDPPVDLVARYAVGARLDVGARVPAGLRQVRHGGQAERVDGGGGG